MAEKRQINNAMQYNFDIACPSCGQRYLIAGLMVQDDEELACSRCNALFQLKIDGDRVEPVLVRPPTGVGPGPAEGDKRQ